MELALVKTPFIMLWCICSDAQTKALSFTRLSAINMQTQKAGQKILILRKAFPFTAVYLKCSKFLPAHCVMHHSGQQSELNQPKRSADVQMVVAHSVIYQMD